jgi:TIR domain-containing protein
MPRAFISYSYDSPNHKQWVTDFAARLRGDGVETILDRWELEPGDQLPAFMERAVRENDFVLIVCTPRYKERSDSRTGGVGFEEDIMTAEVLTAGDQRKFKPVLRSGEWASAAPTWLKGKVYVDLRGEPYSEEQYAELLGSLLGTRPKAPPVKRRQPTSSIPSTPAAAPAAKITDKEAEGFDPIKIIGVIEDEIGHPRNDGTRGSALYEVPFKLSRTPPADWAELFIRNWNQPPQWTSMHRPGIAEVYRDRIVLNGTTMDEVQRYHRDTLKLALDETNKIYSEHVARELQHERAATKERDEHERAARDAAKKIRFD